ncbi:phosphoadenosine phosphosulfate reductase [Pseudohalocynthiibacter sp. F2068]|jgi:hypothetical protein|uniref:phosphoadenosine phosphosulfate reductase n=1 Tax=Pseudohalocynthiibacter sp. F2068 TaxID=2926418 RepID=UPI001FF68130|nr:phosphoadenosine phosphosulfate reductase [Pseudohalocynthiibacter sp. F2068]MCK0101735.1 phosphoadenosine phosphosulfate reductase [Pseudohalocynthiibacter sp. F2068]
MPHSAAGQTPSLQDLAFEDWLEALDEVAEERGYFQPVGPNHSALFTDRDPVLLVTFETVETIRNECEKALPLGFDLVEGKDWSQLCLMAHSASWFRDKAVYAYFDRLIDDGFFEDFDKVVFYGEGMCGYAAASFSVAAPGATVIVVQPQATLDPRITEWDRRYPEMRREDFKNRYGYAPDMIEAAEKAFVVYDPVEALDAMHAALFNRSHVSKLRCPCFGRKIGRDLRNMGILLPLIEQAFEDTLSEQSFYKLFRARREYFPYLRHLVDRLEDNDHLRFAAAACRHAIIHTGASLESRLSAIEKSMSEET